jgi:hypothetical protein
MIFTIMSPVAMSFSSNARRTFLCAGEKKRANLELLRTGGLLLSTRAKSPPAFAGSFRD